LLRRGSEERERGTLTPWRGGSRAGSACLYNALPSVRGGPATGGSTPDPACLPARDTGTSHKPCLLVAGAGGHRTAAASAADAEASLVASHYGRPGGRPAAATVARVGRQFIGIGRRTVSASSEQRSSSRLLYVYSTYARDTGRRWRQRRNRRQPPDAKRQSTSMVGWFTATLLTILTARRARHIRRK